MGEISGEPRRSNSGEAPARFSRYLAAWTLLLLQVAFAASSALGAVPEGPRLATNVFHVFPNAGTEVKTIGPSGEAPLRLAGGADESVPGPLTGSRPAWSPDGNLLAFTGASHGTSGLYVVRADGSGLRLLRSSRRVLFQDDPVFTPDGRALAVTALQVVRGQFNRPAPRHRRPRLDPPLRRHRDKSEQQLDVRFSIWTIGTDGSRPRPLTPWQRRAPLAPASFSPDGKTLVATAYDGRGADAVAIPLGGKLRRGMRVIAKDVLEAALSPDGSRLAFVRDRLAPPGEPGSSRIIRSDLLSVPIAGGPPTLLIRARGGLRWPSWDPSGQRLAFTRLAGPGRGLGFGSEPHQGNSVMQVNADGSCLSSLFSTKRGVIYGTAWQPGPGRGAGSIAC